VRRRRTEASRAAHAFSSASSRVSAPYSTISQPSPSGSIGISDSCIPCSCMSSTSTWSIASQAMQAVCMTSGTWSPASKIDG
jgi:hypothetical protein